MKENETQCDCIQNMRATGAYRERFLSTDIWWHPNNFVGSPSSLITDLKILVICSYAPADLSHNKQSLLDSPNSMFITN